MLLGVIADDFTGASDIANTLARQGMATTLLTTMTAGDLAWADAGVVALKSRSIAPAEAISQSLAALAFLQGLGCRQFVFKYCSTFDSTPEGNIGPVAEALAKALNTSRVICCPTFPAAGRTVYQGHLFVNGVLLSESGMERHPLNPMTDSNIRRWLARQCKSPVGLIDHNTVRKGVAAIREKLASSQERLLIADATTDDDLVGLGEAAAAARLVTGGSGIALGLARNFRASGELKQTARPFAGTTGPGVILAGSCSTATRAQIADYAAHAPAMKISTETLMAGGDPAPAVLDFVTRNSANAPLVYSADDPKQIETMQRRYGQDVLARALDDLFGRLARELAGRGFTRMVVAGGETSGAVVSALRIAAFEVGPEIAAGVPCLLSGNEPKLAMALKSGNFGDARFFSKALAMLEGWTA